MIPRAKWSNVMRKLILFLTLSIILLFPITVKGQNELHLSLVSVDIWPEYDRPAVLVIYRITLSPDTSLPADLVFRIPSDAQINAVAVNDSAAGLINTIFETAVNGKWLTLKLSTNSPKVQVEYYEPLNKDGVTRNIVFDWAGDYAVDRLEVNFLRPLGAENLSVNPTALSSNLGQDGLMNYRIQSANLTSGQPYSVTFRYERKIDDLSISSLPVEAASTPGPDTIGRVSAIGVSPWVMGGIGVFLIVSGIAWFAVWQKRGQKETASPKQMPHNQQHDDDALHCPKCGKRAPPEDVFCRACGTRFDATNG
jgi:hypothetical protein